MLYKKRQEARLYCQLCNHWYHNNQASKRAHENTERHKQSVQSSLELSRQKALLNHHGNSSLDENEDAARVKKVPVW